MNKDQLSDRINDLLGIDVIIDFSGMKKEEMERFVDFLKDTFSDPAMIVKMGVDRMRDKVRSQVLDRPLRDFIEHGFSEDSSEDEGLFGFGILRTKPIVNIKKTLDERRAESQHKEAG